MRGREWESTMNLMATPRKKPKELDRHKAARITRVPAEMAAQLDILCRKNITSMADEVKVAVREYLERHHLWPPPSK